MGEKWPTCIKWTAPVSNLPFGKGIAGHRHTDRYNGDGCFPLGANGIRSTEYKVYYQDTILIRLSFKNFHSLNASEELPILSQDMIYSLTTDKDSASPYTTGSTSYSFSSEPQVELNHGLTQDSRYSSILKQQITCRLLRIENDILLNCLP